MAGLQLLHCLKGNKPSNFRLAGGDQILWNSTNHHLERRGLKHFHAVDGSVWALDARGRFKFAFLQRDGVIDSSAEVVTSLSRVTSCS